MNSRRYENFWYPDLKSEFNEAVKDGEFKKVKRLLKQIRQVELDNALFSAVLYRNFKMIKLLLRSGADVNATKGKGITPLFLAFSICPRSKIAPMVNLLLRYGANVNIQDNNGDTPLMLAVIKRNLLVIKLMVRKGSAYLTITNKKGQTALDMARGDSVLLKALNSTRKEILIYEKPVSYSSKKLITAVERGNLKKVKHIIGRYSQEEKDEALHDAVFHQDLAMVRLLLRNGSDVDCKSVKSPPLLLAMGINKMNSSHMVELLLDFGADVNVQDCQGNTSLMLAAIVEQWNACILIIERGKPDFKIRNNKGETALRLAWGNPFIEKLMIKAGAE